MIRLLQRRLIIPRGDTGSFSIPVLKNSADNIAVFTIFDGTTKTKMFQKMIQGEGDVLNIAFTHNDTVNLKPGKYVWDIKYYSNPEFIDDELVNGEEVDSYYAGFSLPICEIRETGDTYLVSPDAPNAKLSPSQLEIITSALHSINEAIRKTQENVEHYPEIRDEVWYTWDAESGDYISTGVQANGIVGNGIASAVLNDDYTLTLNFTDGTSFTSSSIRGETGNGIDDIVLNNDFTLTITYTDGESYTTPAIRGPIGPTPQFSIGTVQDGAVAAASITGTAENPVLNLTLPNAHVPTRISQLENDSGYLTEHQDLSDYVQKTDYATSSDAGVVKVNSMAQHGMFVDSTDHYLKMLPASSLLIKTGVETYKAIAPFKQHESAFYGLAKAAGDTTQSQSSNAVGAYTDEAKAAIQTMLDVPSNGEMNTAIGTAIGQVNSFDMAVVQALPTQNISTHTIYLVPKTGETNDVYDEYVYINNAWEMVGNTQIDLSNYVQKTDYATSNNAGVVKIAGAMGIDITNGFLTMATADHTYIQDGTHARKAIPPKFQHESAFYGLAKAAGDSTQSVSENAVGTYTDEAKAAIQQMLDVPSNSDMSAYATKTDTILDTTLSRGRKENTTVATGSFAFGSNVQASGNYSFATGSQTVASSQYAHAEGMGTTANARASHAEGTSTQATGMYSHAEGSSTIASGLNAHSEGFHTTANLKALHVSGAYNIIPTQYPTWVSGTQYNIGDIIFYSTNGTGMKCIEANADETFDLHKWENIIFTGDEVFIVGNGTSDNARSNAYALDWNGDGHYMGDVYVHANADSNGGTKLATVEDIPEAPVQDVQVNGVSVLQDGVANVPIAGNDAFGAVRVRNSINFGVKIDSGGSLDLRSATAEQIKNGRANWIAITPSVEHNAAFYGLAKAAGHDEASSTEPLGTYTPEAKGAIQQMLGISDLIATAENNLVASKAYAVGDVFTANGKLYKVTTAIAADEAIVLQNEGEEVAGANAIETKVGEGFIKKTDIGSNSIAGILRVGSGLYLENSTTGQFGVYKATSAQIKQSVGNYNPIVPAFQSDSVFYGLAKAAGADEKDSTLPVGEYTDTAKSAIRTMLGAVGSEDYATSSTGGVVKLGNGITASNGALVLANPSDNDYKTGGTNIKAVVPSQQHKAVFYGLAKAAGDTTQSASSNAIGTYTDNARASIKAMLGIQDGSTGTVNVSGATPTITAVENTRYVCGEVTSLNFTPPASGISIVRFTSGSTVTLLTIPSTVKFPEWFDPTLLETNTIYEICVTDGVYGAVMSWAQ